MNTPKSTNNHVCLLYTEIPNLQFFIHFYFRGSRIQTSG